MIHHRIGEFDLRTQKDDAFVWRDGRLLEEFFGRQGNRSAQERAITFILENYRSTRYQWHTLFGDGRLVPVEDEGHPNLKSAMDWKALAYPETEFVLVQVTKTPLQLSR